MKSNTGSFAENELNILSRTETDPDNRPIIEEFGLEIIALCDKFGASGQSGGSAPYTAAAISQAVKKLCMQEPIAPVTGEDDEWNNLDDMGEPNKYQNKRLSSIFKDGMGGRAYYLDAIIFRGESGSCFTSNSVELADGSYVRSSQYIKEFPFRQKTFYIDVIETEWANKEETVKQEGGGWWTSIVKDESQLEEVFEYYNKRNLCCKSTKRTP